MFWVFFSSFLSCTPISYDKEQVQLTLDNEEHLLKLHDTAGQEEYERIRQVIYKEVRYTRYSIHTQSLIVI